MPFLVDFKSLEFGLSMPISKLRMPALHIFFTISGYFAIASALTRAQNSMLRSCSINKSQRRSTPLGLPMKLGSAKMTLRDFLWWYSAISRISFITFSGDRHLKQPELILGSQQKLQNPLQPLDITITSQSVVRFWLLYEYCLKCRAGKGRISRFSILGLSSLWIIFPFFLSDAPST